jgi:hypothetical protein
MASLSIHLPISQILVDTNNNVAIAASVIQCIVFITSIEKIDQPDQDGLPNPFPDGRGSFAPSHDHRRHV